MRVRRYDAHDDVAGARVFFTGQATVYLGVVL